MDAVLVVACLFSLVSVVPGCVLHIATSLMGTRYSVIGAIGVGWFLSDDSKRWKGGHDEVSGVFVASYSVKKA